MDQKQAVKEIMAELVETARQVGDDERKSLGRELTEAEATRLAAMIECQFRAALVLSQS